MSTGLLVVNKIIRPRLIGVDLLLFCSKKIDVFGVGVAVDYSYWQEMIIVVVQAIPQSC